MNILLDTNRYTDFARGIPDVVTRVSSATNVRLSLFALGELRAGFVGGNRQSRNEAVLGEFLRRPNTGILLPDAATADFYAAVYNDLRKQGTPIPTNDIWMAALAIQHDLTLDARDRHFQHVPRLKLVDGEV